MNRRDAKRAAYEIISVIISTETHAAYYEDVNEKDADKIAAAMMEVSREMNERANRLAQPIKKHKAKS